MRGPDTMSKSKRTQQRYRKTNQNQASLTDLGFTATPSAQSGKIPAASDTIMAVAEPAAMSGPSSSTSRTRSASVLSDPSTASDGEGRADLGDVPEEEADGGHDFDEECESDLNEIVQGPSQTVRNWSDI